MIDVVPIKMVANEDAISMLRGVIERIESGQIKSVGVSWVTREGSICGDVSTGDNYLMMWAALEYTARSFYDQRIK